MANTIYHNGGRITTVDSSKKHGVFLQNQIVGDSEEFNKYCIYKNPKWNPTRTQKCVNVLNFSVDNKEVVPYSWNRHWKLMVAKTAQDQHFIDSLNKNLEEDLKKDAERRKVPYNPAAFENIRYNPATFQKDEFSSNEWDDPVSLNQKVHAQNEIKKALEDKTVNKKLTTGEFEELRKGHQYKDYYFPRLSANNGAAFVTVSPDEEYVMKHYDIDQFDPRQQVLHRWRVNQKLPRAANILNTNAGTSTKNHGAMVDNVAITIEEYKGKMGLEEYLVKYADQPEKIYHVMSQIGRVVELWERMGVAVLDNKADAYHVDEKTGKVYLIDRDSLMPLDQAVIDNLNRQIPNNCADLKGWKNSMNIMAVQRYNGQTNSYLPKTMTQRESGQSIDPAYDYEDLRNFRMGVTFLKSAILTSLSNDVVREKIKNMEELFDKLESYKSRDDDYSEDFKKDKPLLKKLMKGHFLSKKHKKIIMDNKFDVERLIEENIPGDNKDASLPKLKKWIKTKHKINEINQKKTLQQEKIIECEKALIKNSVFSKEELKNEEFVKETLEKYSQQEKLIAKNPLDGEVEKIIDMNSPGLKEWVSAQREMDELNRKEVVQQEKIVRCEKVLKKNGVFSEKDVKNEKSIKENMEKYSQIIEEIDNAKELDREIKSIKKVIIKPKSQDENSKQLDNKSLEENSKDLEGVDNSKNSEEVKKSDEKAAIAAYRNLELENRKELIENGQADQAFDGLDNSNPVHNWLSRRLIQDLPKNRTLSMKQINLIQHLAKDFSKLFLVKVKKTDGSYGYQYDSYAGEEFFQMLDDWIAQGKLSTPEAITEKYMEAAFLYQYLRTGNVSKAIRDNIPAKYHGRWHKGKNDKIAKRIIRNNPEFAGCIRARALTDSIPTVEQLKTQQPGNHEFHKRMDYYTKCIRKHLKIRYRSQSVDSADNDMPNLMGNRNRSKTCNVPSLDNQSYISNKLVTEVSPKLEEHEKNKADDSLNVIQNGKHYTEQSPSNFYSSQDKSHCDYDYYNNGPFSFIHIGAEFSGGI